MAGLLSVGGGFGRACIKRWRDVMAGLVSVRGGFGRACIRRWRGGMRRLVCTVTKSDRFLEVHSKFPPQSQKTFVSDTEKNFTLSKAFFLRLLSGKLFHSGECAFFLL
jgi:hypothetical protein